MIEWSPKWKLYRQIVDRVSNKLQYEGHTDNFTAQETDEVWIVSRTTVDGNITEKTYANQGARSAWSNRYTLFPDVQFINEKSVYLDGNGARVEFGDSFNYNVNTQWSFSIWFKVNNLSVQRCLYSKTTNDVNVYGYGFYLRPDGKIFMQVRGTGGVPNHFSTKTFQSGVWNNLTVTFNGSGNQNGIRLYFNGEVDQAPASAAIGGVLHNQIAMIGSRNTSFNYVGNLDEFTLWDKALSAAEVFELYNQGGAKLATDYSFANSLVNYYRLGDGDPSNQALDNKGSVNGELKAGAVYEDEAA